MRSQMGGADIYILDELINSIAVFLWTISEYFSDPKIALWLSNKS